MTLAVLLGACASPPPGDPPPDSTNISVVTLNIYHDRDGWEKRRMLVIEGLRALRPDIIGLQEVLQHENLRNQAEDIADALGYRFHFVSTDPEGKVRRYGNAILTRHPILRRTERRLRPLQDWRTVAHLRIDIDGTPVDVYNTHLHHTLEGGAIRAQQVADVLAHIEESNDGAPLLLMGDFNAEVTWPELEPLTARFVDAFGSRHDDADTVTTLNPHYFDDARRRIDHIFVQGDRLAVIGSRRVLDRPDAAGTWPSDHFGILARLRLLPARSAPAAGR